MDSQAFFNYVQEQLQIFVSERRCCKQFSALFRSPERLIFTKCAVEFGLRTKIFIRDGMKVLKAYKLSCLHYVEQPTHISLTCQSAKDIFLFLKNSEFIGTQRETQMSPAFFTSRVAKAIVSPHRFSFVEPLMQCMARPNNEGYHAFQKSCKLLSSKSKILEGIRRNRVLVINGDQGLPKSTAVPMFIIENCIQMRTHCKIICIGSHELAAIHNSEMLSQNLREKVGTTVAFQVHLQSRISNKSNLIYTTANFMLRVLMGQSPVDSLRHISHIIISDVHLHNAYTDILLYEIKEAMQFHSHIKIILLSNSSQNNKFISYFGDGEELQLQSDLKSVRLYSLEELKKIISHDKDLNLPSFVYSSHPSIIKDVNCNYTDHTLEQYDMTGSNINFTHFMYLVEGEGVSINYQHSTYRYTALLIAAKFGHINHLTELLKHQPNPYLMDHKNENAISYATTGGHVDFVASLTKYYQVFEGNDSDKNHFDLDLIVNLIRILTTKWEFGNILIFLPNYEYLIRLNFMILKNKLIGNLPQQISMYLLNDNIQMYQLESILKVSLDSIKLILATDIAESLECLQDISYVIDTARVQRYLYNANSKCNEHCLEWVSYESLNRRSRVAGRLSNSGHCFRLISRATLEKLKPVHTPELLIMPLDRICLTVKMLCTFKMVSEYLDKIIVRPPFAHVFDAIKMLKKTEIFDSYEDITWLGCRLIDVPVETDLGKLLVYAILLQCLDPILTIISFLCCSDPLELPSENSSPYAASIRFKIKEERQKISEGYFSDHLMYLRLYQEWQNNRQEDNHVKPLIDEQSYVLNGILEKVCDVRTHLVGSLRSSQLIHNQGQLSMHHINLNSDNWAVIKAALVGGLYPKLIIVDSIGCKLKSAEKRELVLHPSTVLRPLKLELIRYCAQSFPSQWIVYSKETTSFNSNSISYCTLVSPLAVVLFAGQSKMSPINLDQQPNNYEITYGNFSLKICDFFLDDWIWFTLNLSDARIVFKLRQNFFSVYEDFLQHCSDVEKFRKPFGKYHYRLFDTIQKILLQEDLACGFSHPENVGIRPKATPNKLAADFNLNEKQLTNHTEVARLTNDTLKPEKATFNISLNRYETQFFLVHVPHLNDVTIKKYLHEGSGDSAINFLLQYALPDKLTFIIFSDKNREQFNAVAVLKQQNGGINLQECFRNKIPIYELISICLKHKINLPPFTQRRSPFQLEKTVGNIILELFAHRNNWLHNN